MKENRKGEGRNVAIKIFSKIEKNRRKTAEKKYTTPQIVLLKPDSVY